MNKWVGIGNLTKDIDLKFTEGGTAVANFTIAIRRNFKSGSGEYESDFINCVAFNKTAEILGKYTHKGSKIGIAGRIQTRTYNNKEGNKVYVTEIVVDEVEFLEKREQKEETSVPVDFEPVKDDGDIPF
ncbi:single-stranded DNA-binding protein [Clostridium botulinum]|uniref:Single-stranded DNA-binding protein n=1 Tax=Clostridium botulinum CFSAN001627 TaxID=1232189 RepID=M1ZZ82_CLOBO|nr:single-stranded DNA-binding protein [Clostridium botulinum]EKN42978.1 single-strand binding protein family [Clostridium botulinum CFSAN001627]HBJ1686169.1 single-stranded DNA-binding protein [Clostridium botulinum]